MSATLQKAGICPHCGAPLRSHAADAAPAAASDVDAQFVRYDLLALAAEAATDRAFDESAKLRATQQDISRLLEKRRRTRK